METNTSLAKLETHLKAHFSTLADKQRRSDAAMIPPLTAEQYAAVKNWNFAWGYSIGALIGLTVGKHPLVGLGVLMKRFAFRSTRRI